MTISTEVRKAGPFIGNGSASSFPFAFKVFKAADLIVVRRQDNIGVETTLVLDSDYHVTLNVNQDTTPGGVVALTGGALADGFTLIVSSELPYLQTTDLTNQGGFYPKVITNALDRLTIFCQQLAEITGRTLKLPITAPTNISAEIPLPNPSELIAWNETGTGLTTISPQSLVTSIAYGTATADLFAGDGVTTTFPLTTNPASVNNLDVSIGGYSQRPVQNGVGDYSWNGGASITFVTPPPAPTVSGDKNVLVRYMQAIPVSDSEALQAQTREALRRGYAEAGYTLVAGSFETGGTLTSATDVLLHKASGIAYSGPIGQVAAGTNPASVGFVDRSGVVFSNGIDITRWGVIPDGAMDASVVLPYIQSLGAGQVVRLPFVAGTLNVYYFSAFNPSTTVGVKFVVDPGVSVSLPNDYMVGDPQSVSQYFSRDTKLIFRSLGGSDYVAGAKAFSPMAAIDSDASKVAAISPGTFFTPQKVSWPNSDTFESDAFAFTDANSALFQYAPGDGKFHIGSVRPRVGDKYSMPLPVSGGAFPCVLVQDQNGFSGVYFSDSNASTCTVFRKNVGATGTSSIVNYPMQGNHDSYAAINSEVQLHVVSANRYDVLLNGFTVALITTNGPIDLVGFGAFFTATPGTFAVNLLYPTVLRKYEGVGSRFVALSVFGDSRSSNRMDCWTEKAKKIADGSAGLRLWDVYNNAVAGQTSAQQLAIMQSVGVASANVVVISVGTNDAQSQVGVPTYKANLEAMCDICIAAGKPFIIVKPPLWYTQAQSGGKGQPSANYQLTSQYRAICSLVCANKGGKLVDIDAELGPIVSYYVNSASAVNMVGKGDPVVFDNIHFTGAANDIMATAVVKAVMAITCADGYKDGYFTDWLTVKALNSWLINTGDNPLQISATKDGAISLTGRVFKSTGSTTDGTAIAKVPQILSPRFYTEWMVRGDANNAKVSIGSDGVVKIYGMSTNNYVSLSGCGWSL